jgi:hypothetical protein
MSTVQGGQGNIVTNGLVLNLDAANPRSYPQPYNGTTWQNLVPVSSSISGSLINGIAYTGSNNGSLVFNSTSGSFISVISNANFPSISQDSQSFSISCWIKGTVSGSGNVVIGQDFSSTANGWNGLFFNSTLVYAVIGNNTTRDLVSISHLLTTSSFKAFTATYDGTQLSLYVNGYLGNLASSTVFPNLNNSNKSWTIGGNFERTSPANSGFLQGEIPAVHFYNRALNASEVLQNFNATRARFGV